MPVATCGLTWTQVRKLDEAGWLPDGFVFDLIDGHLMVRGSPSIRHQRTVMRLAIDVGSWADTHGGEALSGPTAVSLDEANTVQPDLVYVRPQDTDRVLSDRIVVPPGLVVEVSSPGTRGLDMIDKHDLYERMGIEEYWSVDLQDDRILVHRLAGDRYGDPVPFVAGQTLEPAALPGFSVAVDRILDAGR
jgi:Uma2 family endonuclease